MTIIFVTIGYPNSRIPVMNKVAIRSEIGKEIKSAKLLRQRVSSERKISPSMFTWAVFKSVKDDQPFKHSDNWNSETLVSCERENSEIHNQTSIKL